MSGAERFEQNIGYAFKDADLLVLALSHPSQEVRRNNERLEFLGDRVLGLIIADYLISEFPDANEGDLARRLAHLASGVICGQIAAKWEFESVIRRANDKLTERVLSNFCEAIIGAIYLDRGLEEARKFVLRHWGARLNEQPPIDGKTRLQEWSMQAGYGLPVYKKLSQTGSAHAPSFVYEVSITKMGAATGKGSSRRQAEQAAAEALLIELKDKKLDQQK